MLILVRKLLEMFNFEQKSHYKKILKKPKKEENYIMITMIFKRFFHISLQVPLKEKEEQMLN